MPRKVKLAANILGTLVITLAPIYIPILLILHFGFGIQTILASILFVQIYIFIIQAEVMLRQAALSRAGYDTSFDVRKVPIEASPFIADNTEARTKVEIVNSGDKPAYNLFVGARDESRNKSIPPKMNGGFTLKPGERQTFTLPISDEEFIHRKIVLIISYDNVLGDMCDVWAVSSEGSNNFLMMPLHKESGFLIKAYQNLMLYIRWYFRYRKWRALQKKSS
jgi:hypothetical protein